MSDTKNENERKKGGKGKTVGAVVAVVLLVVIIQSCFDSSKLPEEQEPVTTNQSEQESEPETTETESTETESTEAESAETETLSEEMFEELEAEEGRYINPGETYACDDGDRDYILYANIFPEDDLSVRFVGFAKTKDGSALPEMNLDIILSSTDAVNYTDGTYTLIYDEYGDGIQFWNTVDDSDDFYGQFFPIVNENAVSSSSTEDVIYLSTDRATLQNFVRDESNIGKTVCMTLTIDWGDASGFSTLIANAQENYHFIIQFTNNENCPVLFAGDTVTVTGTYTGYDASGTIKIDTLSVQ